MRFSSRAGDTTKFEKIASPARAKNRSCGRGFTGGCLRWTVVPNAVYSQQQGGGGERGRGRDSET